MFGVLMISYLVIYVHDVTAFDVSPTKRQHDVDSDTNRAQILSKDVSHVTTKFSQRLATQETVRHKHPIQEYDEIPEISSLTVESDAHSELVQLLDRKTRVKKVKDIAKTLTPKFDEHSKREQSQAPKLFKYQTKQPSRKTYDLNDGETRRNLKKITTPMTFESDIYSKRKQRQAEKLVNKTKGRCRRLYNSNHWKTRAETENLAAKTTVLVDAKPERKRRMIENTPSDETSVGPCEAFKRRVYTTKDWNNRAKLGESVNATGLKSNANSENQRRQAKIKSKKTSGSWRKKININYSKTRVCTKPGTVTTEVSKGLHRQRRQAGTKIIRTTKDTTSPDLTSPDTTSPDSTSPDATSPDAISLDTTSSVMKSIGRASPSRKIRTTKDWAMYITRHKNQSTTQRITPAVTTDDFFVGNATIDLDIVGTLPTDDSIIGNVTIDVDIITVIEPEDIDFSIEDGTTEGHNIYTSNYSDLRHFCDNGLYIDEIGEYEPDMHISFCNSTLTQLLGKRQGVLVVNTYLTGTIDGRTRVQVARTLFEIHPDYVTFKGSDNYCVDDADFGKPLEMAEFFTKTFLPPIHVEYDVPTVLHGGGNTQIQVHFVRDYLLYLNPNLELGPRQHVKPHVQEDEDVRFDRYCGYGFTEFGGDFLTARGRLLAVFCSASVVGNQLHLRRFYLLNPAFYVEEVYILEEDHFYWLETREHCMQGAVCERLLSCKCKQLVRPHNNTLHGNKFHYDEESVRWKIIGDRGFGIYISKALLDKEMEKERPAMKLRTASPARAPSAPAAAARAARAAPAAAPAFMAILTIRLNRC